MVHILATARHSQRKRNAGGDDTEIPGSSVCKQPSKANPPAWRRSIPKAGLKGSRHGDLPKRVSRYSVWKEVVPKAVSESHGINPFLHAMIGGFHCSIVLVAIRICGELD